MNRCGSDHDVRSGKKLLPVLAVLSLLFFSPAAVQGQGNAQRNTIPAVPLLLLAEEQTGPTYTITSSITGTPEDGTITPFGAVSVRQGASQSFVIQATDGWKLEELRVDYGPGQMFPELTTYYIYTFTNVQADHTIDIHFHRI